MPPQSPLLADLPVSLSSMNGIVLPDPLATAEMLWPQYKMYAGQRDIMLSVEHNIETFVVAGNQAGKDFIFGMLCANLWHRCLMAEVACCQSPTCGLCLGKGSRPPTCRIVTTSVREDHLRVLWAEIARFMLTARLPLLADRGGPHVMQHMEIRRATEKDAKNPISYMVGMVSEKGEGLAGHHAEITLAVGDEASGIEDKAYEHMQGWAKRLAFFGNAWSCDNFWRKGIDAGDLVAL